MRLRILELPPDDIRVTTPVAVVLDDVSPDLKMGDLARMQAHVRDALGARSALIFQERVELDGDRR